MPYLERSGDVHVLYLGDKDGPENNENRFHPDWIDAVHALLDEVEAVEGPAALVTTATSQPALRTGFVMLGLASLLDLSTGRHGAGADRVLAMSGAAAAGWYLVESRRRH